jgi:hypothetical protein
MAQCAYCGAETQLYSFGRPICLECVEDRKKGSDPRRESSQSQLVNRSETPSQSGSSDD